MPVLSSICAVSDVLTVLGIQGSASDAARGLIQLLIPLAEDALRDHVGYSITQQSYTQLYPDRTMHVADEQEYLDITAGRITFRQKSASRILQLSELPVRSITEVREDSAAYAGQGSSDFAASTILTSGTDYFLNVDQTGISRTGHLERIGATWPSRSRTVQVQYPAGYTAAELDGTATNGIRAQALRYAAIQTVAAAFNESDAQGTGAFGTGGALASETISTNAHAVTYDTAANSLLIGMQVRLPPKAIALAQPFVRFRR